MTNYTHHRAAIRTIIKQMGGSATYPEISVRSHLPLASSLMEMVQDGEINRASRDGKTYYTLTGSDA